MIVFFVFVSLILFFEWKWNKKTFLTPLFFMVVPVSVMVLLINVFYIKLGFVSVSNQTLLLLSYPILIFFVSGMIIRSLCRFPVGDDMRCLRLPRNEKYFNILSFAFILILAYMLYDLRGYLGSGAASMGNEEFASKGVLGHINNLLLLPAIYYSVRIFKSSKLSCRLLSAVIVLLIFIIKLYSGVRGNFLLIIVSILSFFLLSGYLKITIKTIILFLVISASIFILPTILLNISADEGSDYLYYYFLYYSASGLMGFSSYLSTSYYEVGVNPDYIFAVLDNILKVLSGDNRYIDIVNPDFADVSTSLCKYSFGSNVFTLFGDVYINVGIFDYFLFFITLAVFSYVLYYKSFTNIYIRYLYSYISAILFMAFFAQYFLFIAFYEIVAVLLVLNFLSKIKIK